MREKIKATKTFKKLEKFQQDLILKRPSVKKIEDACIQIRNIGFDAWKQENNLELLS